MARVANEEEVRSRFVSMSMSFHAFFAVIKKYTLLPYHPILQINYPLYFFGNIVFWQAC